MVPWGEFGRLRVLLRSVHATAPPPHYYDRATTVTYLICGVVVGQSLTFQCMYATYE